MRILIICELKGESILKIEVASKLLIKYTKLSH